MSDPQTYSDEELARAWAKRFSQSRRRIVLMDDTNDAAGADSRIELETKWAFDELEKLVAQDPAHAWLVILKVLAVARDDEAALDNLAAGPLETLLVRHGRTVLPWIEKQARADPSFKELLAGVWENAMNPIVWQRIQQIVES